MQCGNVAAMFVSRHDRARNDAHDETTGNNNNNTTNPDGSVNDHQCVSMTESCERPPHPAFSLHLLIALRNWQPVNLRE